MLDQVPTLPWRADTPPAIQPRPSTHDDIADPYEGVPFFDISTVPSAEEALATGDIQDVALALGLALATGDKLAETDLLTGMRRLVVEYGGHDADQVDELLEDLAATASEDDDPKPEDLGPSGSPSLRLV